MKKATAFVRQHLVALAACSVLIGGLLSLNPLLAIAAPSPAGGPNAKWHYAPNSNFNDTAYAPAALGFNLADVDDPAQLTYLHNSKNKGTEKALVWIGTCDGATSAFKNKVRSFEKNKYKNDILAYFLMDEPDPTGTWHSPKCSAASLKAQSDWVHHNTGRKTFITMMNMSSNKSPDFKNTYKPANTGIDYYGIDPYPCRTELKGCSFSEISKHVKAAESWGIPRNSMIPVYQAFGGGNYVTDGGGKYFLPSASQTKKLLSSWHKELPAPAFDFAYSWGVQERDKPLSKAPQSVKDVYKLHNKQ